MVGDAKRDWIIFSDAQIKQNAWKRDWITDQHRVLLVTFKMKAVYNSF